MNEDDTDEKRGQTRQKTLKSGIIVYQNGNCTMTCTILDLSANGARLKPADSTMLPEEFELRITHGASHHCEVIRRTRDQIAVRFV